MGQSCRCAHATLVASVLVGANDLQPFFVPIVVDQLGRVADLFAGAASDWGSARRVARRLRIAVVSTRGEGSCDGIAR